MIPVRRGQDGLGAVEVDRGRDLAASPRITARSVACPLPVQAREPSSVTVTFAVAARWPAVLRLRPNDKAASIGPTVWDDDGPMPILKSSNTPTMLIQLRFKVMRGFPFSRSREKVAARSDDG